MNRPVDISPNHLDMVLAILHKHLPAEVKVWVFGSRADWTTRDSSDLDLALEGDSTLDYDTIMKLEMAFEVSSLPYKVDVIDLDQVSDSFRRIVDAQKVLLPLTNDTPSRNRNWRTVRLEDLINIIRGRSYSSDQLQDNLSTALVTLKSFRRNGGYREDGLKPYIGPYDEDQVVYPNDIVVAQTDITQNGDVIGRPAIIPNNVPYLTLVASLDVAIIKHKLKNNLSPTFLYYRLLADDYIHHAKSHSTGTTVLHMRRDGINKFKFSLPSLDEQRSIAHILRTLDEKIDLNQRMSQTLEKMAQALFKSWFVDFDPVRAKMEGRWMPGKSLPSLPAHLYDLFPKKLVDSELGEVPEGWEVKELGEIAEQHRSSAKPIEIEPSTPYIALKHMPKRCITLSEWKTSENLASNKYRFKRGDILFGKLRPYFHKVGVAPLAGVCSTDIVVISPLSQDWFGLILCHVSSSEFIDYTESVSIGTKMPRTNWTDMSRYKIAFPKQELAKVFTKMIQLYINKIILTTHNSHTLATKRNVLLPRLISGELRTSQWSCRRSVSK